FSTLFPYTTLFRSTVREQDEIHVSGADLALRQNARSQPADEAGPVVRTEADERKLRDLAGLDERECLEKLVQRTKSTWKVNERRAVLDEHRLSNHEVAKVHQCVHVGI